MMLDSLLQNPLDIIALVLFLVVWIAFSHAAAGRFSSKLTLTLLMNRQREIWMRTMASRELRMIDTSIMNGLQQGTAFFASSAIFAIGGCFALLGSSQQVLDVLNDLPANAPARAVFEAKVLGLIAILAYAFFKFGWSYRLFNYCSILIGAVPVLGNEPTDDVEMEVAVRRAAQMNVLGGKHFNAGLRTIFFALGYLGWFVGPWVFMGTTLFILGVLIRRQFFSVARQSLLT